MALSQGLPQRSEGTAKKRSFRAVPRQEDKSRHAQFDNVNCESLLAAVGIVKAYMAFSQGLPQRSEGTAKKRSFRAVPRQENISRHARFGKVTCVSLSFG